MYNGMGLSMSVMQIKKPEWLEVRGQRFTPGEAKEASDFAEIVREYGLSMDQVVEWFGETLSVGRRLFLVEKCPKEKLLSVVIDVEVDERISAIVRDRFYGGEKGIVVI